MVQIISSCYFSFFLCLTNLWKFCTNIVCRMHKHKNLWLPGPWLQHWQNCNCLHQSWKLVRLGHKKSTELHHFTIHHVNRNFCRVFCFSDCWRYSPNILLNTVYIYSSYFCNQTLEAPFFLESYAVILCIFVLSFLFCSDKLQTKHFKVAFLVSLFHFILPFLFPQSIRCKRTKSVSGFLVRLCDRI